jgi:hypothetical protein
MKKQQLLRTSVPSTQSPLSSAPPVDAESGASGYALKENRAPGRISEKPVRPSQPAGSEPRQHDLEKGSANRTDRRRCLFEMCTPEGRTLFTIERL